MRIAILTSNTGVEESELTSPRNAILGRNWRVDHLAPEVGDVQTMQGDITKSSVVQADLAIRDANLADYTGVVIPGGTVNADTLRLDADAIDFVRRCAESRTPVAVICHGPWALVEAGVVEGKTLTSYPSLRTDITNAGGTWVDEPVVHCTAKDWDVITSRNPGDLDAFNATLLHVFGLRGD